MADEGKRGGGGYYGAGGLIEGNGALAATLADDAAEAGLDVAGGEGDEFADAQAGVAEETKAVDLVPRDRAYQGVFGGGDNAGIGGHYRDAPNETAEVWMAAFFEPVVKAFDGVYANIDRGRSQVDGLRK